MRRTLFFFVALCVSSVASTFAQDIIILKNGNDIQALVQEIGELDVKYKKFDNPNGPNYTLKKAEISMIRYANGSKDIFNEKTAVPPTVTKSNTSIQNENSPTNLHFTLTKSSVIKIRPTAVKRRFVKMLENELLELGFAVIKQRYDGVEPTVLFFVHSANRTISRPSLPPYRYKVLSFRIVDVNQNRVVFEKEYKRNHSRTKERVIEDFIGDITPFMK